MQTATTTTEQRSPRTPGGWQARLRSSWRQQVIYVGFGLTFLCFAVFLHQDGFLDPANLLNIVRQTSMISLMAVAMTFVLCGGEIDLSVGAVAGLASVITAMTISSFGVIAGILAGVGSGILVGLINGTLTTTIGIPSFLTTLAVMGIARGVAMWISGTGSIPILNDFYAFVFGGGNVGPVPVLLIWTFAAVVLGQLVLRRTVFGRRVLATGGNETAARYSGVETRKIKFYTLVVSSVSAALAGMLYAGRLQTGRFQLGEGDELSVIAAAVLGGTSLFGGVGSVVGSIVGALMIGMINNGLILIGLDYSQQLVARGLIIIAAVALSQERPR
jgi:ribose transport system permease protein